MAEVAQPGTPTLAWSRRPRRSASIARTGAGGVPGTVVAPELSPSSPAGQAELPLRLALRGVGSTAIAISAGTSGACRGSLTWSLAAPRSVDGPRIRSHDREGQLTAVLGMREDRREAISGGRLAFVHGLVSCVWMDTLTYRRARTSFARTYPVNRQSRTHNLPSPTAISNSSGPLLQLRGSPGEQGRSSHPSPSGLARSDTSRRLPVSASILRFHCQQRFGGCFTTLHSAETTLRCAQQLAFPGMEAGQQRGEPPSIRDLDD